jgi:glycosyltransferase involved in cell wall biosynthesis
VAEPLRVCGLVPYPLDRAPSQRFRLEQWRPLLEAQGIRLDLVPFADEDLMSVLHKPGRPAAKALGSLSALWRRLGLLPGLRAYDAVVVHRAVCLWGPAVLERVIARLRAPLIFDFDDAIYMLHTTAANRRWGWLKFPGKTGTICRLSRHVVAGNEYLAAYARGYNTRVSIVPTSIDTDAYRPVAAPPRESRVVLGWTGSSTSQTHLEAFAPVLRSLASRREVTVRVCSDREPSLPGVPRVQWQPWSADVGAEVAELARYDVGIMPVPDDAFSRGKCALKALQYMAMGVATVCSPVGANRDLIRHGANGLLATTPEEWLAALESLIDDPSLRRRLGQAGRQTVVDGYSARHCAELFSRVVRDAAGR